MEFFSSEKKTKMVAKNKGEKKRKKPKTLQNLVKYNFYLKKRKRPVTEEMKLKALAQTSMKFQPFLAE